MAQDVFHSSSAWILIGIHGSKAGTLTLSKGRLSFVDDDNKKSVFDVPFSEVMDLTYPWQYFGGGVNFRIGSEKYRISFVLPHYEYGLAEGLEVAKAWKPLLTGR
ncbi:hypothetical protein EON83_30510 [bacterium]|nr:MAG: hypothetical protein EON83_30510 [bacterium]